MGRDTPEKGCTYFAGKVITLLLGAAVGGVAGLYVTNNMAIAACTLLVSGIVADAVYRGWWTGMVTVRKRPIVAVLLFTLLAMMLMVGLVFLGLSFHR